MSLCPPAYPRYFLHNIWASSGILPSIYWVQLQVSDRRMELMINTAIAKALLEAGLSRGVESNYPGAHNYIPPRNLINLAADDAVVRNKQNAMSKVDADEAGPSGWKPKGASTPKRKHRRARRKRRHDSESSSDSSMEKPGGKRRRLADSSLDETVTLKNPNKGAVHQDPVSGDSFSEVELSITDHGSAIVSLHEEVIDSQMANETANRQTAMDQLLSNEYDDDLPKSSLPSINAKLATTVSGWCRNVPSRDKIKDTFKNSLLPVNVEGLLPVRINEVLYMRLPFNVKLNDQRLRGINSFFARGLGPIVSVLDSLVKLETTIPDNRSVSVQKDEKTITLDKIVFDVQEMRRLLAIGVKLLSYGHAACLQKRKTNLRPSLDSRYQYLTKPGNIVTEELLGPNLEQKINDSNRLIEASRRISVRKPFFNKGNIQSNSGRNTYNNNTYRGRFVSRPQRHSSARSRPYTSNFRRSSGSRPYNRRAGSSANSQQQWYNKRQRRH